MQLEVTELDWRFTGKRHFKYMVRPYYASRIDHDKLFVEMRQWCWEQYGPSCEYRWYKNVSRDHPDFNKRWAWEVHNKGSQCRIFLKNREDVNWMVLRWG